jgi:hydrogenase maturation protease
MMSVVNKILLIGIGNCGRGDDGLGWRFIEELEEFGGELPDCEFRYQLQIEDAELISHYDTVIFVDASHIKLTNGFEMNVCVPSDQAFFTTHAQLPEAVLNLTKHLYNKFPKAYTLAISGTEWELSTCLSSEAENNLKAALYQFKNEFLPAIGLRNVLDKPYHIVY